MFSFEVCHPEHIPLPSLLILQINVCSAEETVSFKVKGLFSLAVLRTAATYWTFPLLLLSSVNVTWVAVFAAACLVYLLTWNSLYEAIALCACSVNFLTSLLTKSYDIVYIIKRFWANRASYFFIHFKILECLKIIRTEIRLCQAYLIDLAVLFLV